jgi:hypothetical protein
MVKFNQIDPTEFEDSREGRRGRVSYPILKSFLETGFFMAQLDRHGMQQSYQALYSSLTAYIRNHVLPIKLFSRGGQIILMRLDVDKDGNEIPDWQQRILGLTDDSDEDAAPINPDTVARRYDVERFEVTK